MFERHQVLIDSENVHGIRQGDIVKGRVASFFHFLDITAVVWIQHMLVTINDCDCHMSHPFTNFRPMMTGLPLMNST